ncbi:MAG: hypothetical protein FJ276_28765 [Planctomycetes bacterium]|nr:hypothetical protein [Planctomycetota bacterium]
MSETLRRLYEIGLDGGIDSTELDRRRANLVLLGVQLRFNEARLTGQVKTLIGADPMSTWQIETECAIEPRGPEFELVDALAIGRENDAQLSALRKLKNSNRPEDMELARKLMSVVSPLAGQEQSRCWLLILLSASCGENSARNRRESGLRRSQMSELHDARQQQLDLEIAAAFVNIRQQLVQVGIAKDVQESWEERVAVLESHRELQKSGYLDVINAKSELLKAKSALYHELILLEIAHVKLHTAIGWYGQQCMTPGMQPGDVPCLPGPGLAEGAMSRDRLRY